MALRISLKHERDPGWFYSLPREDQVSLIALERLQPPPQAAPAPSPVADVSPSIQSAIAARMAQLQAERGG
jgi:hypothetical protein